ncbi:Alpha beta hydrolase [Seminavis robusta]|uniref:Alpha beta hydrolase n=1 Tax=Seminavis robusta TaxID=568900 RepID=A0A9N8E8U5_9STRA|nr:Alpha beta hydrolase [Seminavis robusta]|eukprot:Sro811_g205980.1 Alpha beta hydrolase (301) ;mRNA; r:43468-44370
MPPSTAPFDLNKLHEATANAPPPPEPIVVTATDGIELAVRIYRPPAAPKGILVFYHGGGAHSAAGYHLMAQKLATDHDIQVYTPDLRGHGESGGPRGDAPSPQQVYQDVDSVLELVGRQEESTLPLFLGGHSSGAGLVIQYATQSTKQQQQDNNIKGYLLLSPQLGPNAGVANDGTASSSFAKVSVLPFILNGIFGVMGHYPSVRFQYSDQELADPRMVSFNTVHMANAISPMEPAKQLEQMTKDCPTILWMGERDELFVASKVQSLYAPTVIVPEATHLGILVVAHKLMGPWMEQQMME